MLGQLTSPVDRAHPVTGAVQHECRHIQGWQEFSDIHFEGQLVQLEPWFGIYGRALVTPMPLDQTRVGG